MDYVPNNKDIFLWADGYWCYREDFYSQGRQTYTYRLVMTHTPQWLALTGAEPYTRSSPYQTDNRNRSNAQPDSHRRSQQ